MKGQEGEKAALRTLYCHRLHQCAAQGCGAEAASCTFRVLWLRANPASDEDELE